MKVIVQIPCLNEEKTLPLVINSIPKKIKGVNELEILVIDDGSKDDTVEVAKKLGVKHFVIHRSNLGLARSFHDGALKALSLGADIVVNTDGDNQYPQDKIPELIKPILDGEAEIVIADRQTHKIAHFSFTKKLLQRLGTKVVNFAAGTDIPDAASGFRAYSKESLLLINTVTTFSYVIETTIQAGNKRLAIKSIPVDTNPKLRESRLFKSTPEHVFKSGVTVVRAYIMYKPFVIFSSLATILFVGGLIPFVRYFILRLDHNTGNHLQSLLIGAVLFIGAFLALALGVIADLIRINRALNEKSLEYSKRQMLNIKF